MFKSNFFQLFVICFLLIFASSCRDKEKNTAEIITKKRIALKTPPELLLAQITDLTVKPGSKEFCLTDLNNNCVWVFDSTGNYIRHFGRKGQGPGEFDEPLSLDFKNNQLAVVDKGNSRVQFFDWEGNYLHGFVLSNAGMINGIVWSSVNHRLVVSESLGMIHFSFWNEDGTSFLRRKYPINGILMPVQLAGGSVTETPEGDILYSDLKSYDVVRLNWQGDTLNHYINNKEYFRPVTKSGNAFLRQKKMDLMITPFQIGKYIVVQRMRMDKEKGLIVKGSKKFTCDIFYKSGKLFKEGITNPFLPAIATDNRVMYSISYPDSEENLNPEIIVLGLKILTNSKE